MAHVSQAQFARLCGCSRKTVTRWKQRGMLVVTQGGQVDIEASFKRLERLRRSGAPAFSGDASDAVGSANSGNSPGNTNANMSANTRIETGNKTDDETPANETHHSQARDGSAGLSLAEALRVKTGYQALLRQLEYKRKTGTLIEMAAAENAVFEVCREQRNAWLNWPVRVAPLIAMELGIDDVDRLASQLQEHVHQQLVELGEPQQDQTAAS